VATAISEYTSSQPVLVGHTFDIADDTEPIFIDSQHPCATAYLDARCGCGETVTVFAETDLIVIEHARSCAWLLRATRGRAALT
jgi:hypothetical protein